MGLIKFVKQAGAKVLGKDKDLTKTEDFQELRQGNLLMQHVMGLGLEIDDLKITYDDGVASVFGKTESQAEREKVILAVGNTKDVESVDDMIQVVKAEPEAVYYTVISGDSLSKIAKAQYGDAMKYPLIFEANQPMLTDPDKIYPGQVLRIPPLEA